jgi:hypothetical protein
LKLYGLYSARLQSGATNHNPTPFKPKAERVAAKGKMDRPLMGETKDLQMEILEEKKTVSLNVLEAATIARVGRSTICEELASGRLLSRSSHDNPCASRMVGSFAKEAARLRRRNKDMQHLLRRPFAQ